MARRWSPGWRMSVLVLLMLPVLVSLGFWQLERAAEKRGYEDVYLERQSQMAVAPPAQLQAFEFGRVKLTGHFDGQHQILLDNQTKDGRVGYWVISRFVGDDGRGWLVNRGWVAATSSRERLPDIAISTDPMSIVAVVWPDTGLMPLLAEDPWQQGWPKLVQRMDARRIAAVFDDVEPIELRLEAGQPGVLSPAPLTMPMAATKHIGYAVQWFALATMLSVGFIIFGFRSK